jgi:hypothetical protein
MSKISGSPENVGPTKTWESVPLARAGWFSKLTKASEYFGYGFVAVVAGLAAWYQATGPHSSGGRPASWTEGPAGLAVSLPAFFLTAYLILVRLLDALLPEITFEGTVTKLEMIKVADYRMAIPTWSIECGDQRWRLDRAALSERLDNWLAVGCHCRIRHSALRRSISLLEVRQDRSTAAS